VYQLDRSELWKYPTGGIASKYRSAETLRLGDAGPPETSSWFSYCTVSAIHVQARPLECPLCELSDAYLRTDRPHWEKILANGCCDKGELGFVAVCFAMSPFVNRRGAACGGTLIGGRARASPRDAAYLVPGEGHSGTFPGGIVVPVRANHSSKSNGAGCPTIRLG
jgi:hypothetical protein